MTVYEMLLDNYRRKLKKSQVLTSGTKKLDKESFSANYLSTIGFIT